MIAVERTGREEAFDFSSKVRVGAAGSVEIGCARRGVEHHGFRKDRFDLLPAFWGH
jgi:hypothetical protein